MARIHESDGKHTAFHTASLAAWDAMTEADIASMSRAECIGWLCWNDHNGSYADDQLDEGMEPLTLEDARALLSELRFERR